MKGSLRRGILLLLFAILPSPLFAVEVWEAADACCSLSVTGFLKTQTLLVDFYEHTFFPASWGGEERQRARLMARFFAGDIEVALDFETRLSLETEGFASLETFGDVATTTAKPRLWDIEVLSADGVRWENDLDRLFLRFPVGWADITVGRQVVSWGSAWFWKPTDRFSPFAPTDIDPDVKRGIDAVRAEIFLGATSSLDLVTSFERNPGRIDTGARFRTTVGRYDLALSAARFDDAPMGGIEFSGALGSVGFRGEGAVNYDPGPGRWDVEGVVGFDYHFPIRLTLAGEAFYNGYGVTDPSDYLPFLLDPQRSERLRRGEAFNFGRYYLGLAADQELHPLVHLLLSAITNLGDPSALFSASLAVSVQENVRFTAGLLLPAGPRPTDPENPLETELRSEFGAQPTFGYTVLEVSF